ncbi:MAG: SPFH domain-containing protein, partial [Clostridia bacterium]|nr:SPFH domain-containing protein [Clostridia bacterium]
MTNMFLISGGALAGIVIGAAAVVALAVIIFLLFYKKNNRVSQGSKDFVEFSGDNTELFKVVDLGSHVRNNATVIVPPTHNALIIRNGSIVNVCSEGEFPLTENGVTVHSLKVIYISKTAKVTVNWGTKLHQRIEYIDPKVGKPVSVGAFGVMDVRVSDPKKFYLELVANFGQVFSTQDLQDRIRTLAVDDTFRAIGKVLNDKKLSYVEFTSAKYYIQTQVGNYLSDKFSDEFGFAVSNFI